MRSILPLLLAFMSAAAAAQSPPSSVSGEIEQLFAALNRSDCRFYRNGSWHEAAAASAHLRQKYDYLLQKGLVSSTESFIDLAAAKSSLSGTPYQVKCGTTAPVESRQWFSDKLRELRAGR
jgi:hypothetical protein